ncbi:glycosyltransferase family 2 protein [Candidatus Albibeggiatoa sp. nov. NOAA]|uniref:glycosyltransferase family 2 protein n=1 Tax=Candidatus Albibeggiatoa sp. nov. NOAA TaxID=3162724 RepID=UPI0033014130|nr:glycosyltransferase family 2 protein [Thiotrichaceae bacterium]
MKVSIILSTYNRPDALTLILQALSVQTYPHFEVVVADDGSGIDTKELIYELRSQMSYELHHLWQEDKGFRLAMARNKAVAKASGDYLIFLDGDCVPRPHFIERHCQLAESGYFVTGNRILLNEHFTIRVLFHQIQIGQRSNMAWVLPYLHGDINRFLPLFSLPDGQFRKVDKPKWQGAKTCNLGAWKQDVLDINGFNEQFQGWGHEDAEFVVRLMHNQVKRKEGRFAVPVFHLWHPEADRSREQKNRQRLEQCLHSTQVVADSGVNQYL